jgi:hypothetical protein
VFSLVFFDPDCYRDHDDEVEREKCRNWRKETFSKDGYLTVGFMTLGEIALGLENFPDDEPALTFVLFFFLFIIVIVMMNVLIAIVSDSYDDAMTRAEMLFWCSQLDLIAESTILFKPGNVENGGSFPTALVKGREPLLADIKEHLVKSKNEKKWAGRVVESVRRIETDTEFKTKRLGHEMMNMKLEILDEIKLILEEQRALVAPTMRKGDSSSTRQTSSRNEMERTFHRRRERMFR